MTSPLLQWDWTQWTRVLQHPAGLWWLIAIPLLVWVWRQANQQRRHSLAAWSGEHAELYLTPRRWLGRIILVGIILNLIIAWDGPLWGIVPLTPIRSARDLLLLVDVSQSMLAEDRPPESRLRRAQGLVARLLEEAELAGGRIRVGLGVFAGNAAWLSPPTEDWRHLRQILLSLSPQSMGELGRLSADSTQPAGTSFKNLITLLRDWFKNDPASLPFSDILIVTDGDDIIPDAQLAAAAAIQSQLTLNVIGIGDPAQEWPIPSGGSYLTFSDPTSGQTRRVLTRRQDAALTNLSHPTGGRLFLEEAALPPLLAWFHEVVEKSPTRPLESQVRYLPQNRADWFLLAALALIMLEFAFGGARQRAW